jgi:hypothetical protein
MISKQLPNPENHFPAPAKWSTFGPAANAKSGTATFLA